MKSKKTLKKKKDSTIEVAEKTNNKNSVKSTQSVANSTAETTKLPNDSIKVAINVLLMKEKILK